MKENKKMVNYFKKWEGSGTLGIGMLAAGFLFLWLGMSMFSYFLAVFLFAAGLAVFLYGNIGRANATQINDTIKNQIESVRFPELEEDSKLRKRTPKEYKTLEFQAFDMHDGVYIKRKKDASLISSEYTYAKVAILSDAFYIKKIKFSMVSDEKSAETFDIPFSSISDITIERDAFTITSADKKTYPVKNCHMVIIYGDGQNLLLPKQDDAFVEDFANDLKRKYIDK